MARKPPPPPTPSGPASDQRQHASEGRARVELVGPVAIARHVKDDGRALILYSHAQDAGE